MAVMLLGATGSLSARVPPQHWRTSRQWHRPHTEFCLSASSHTCKRKLLYLVASCELTTNCLHLEESEAGAREFDEPWPLPLSADVVVKFGRFALLPEVDEPLGDEGGDPVAGTPEPVAYSGQAPHVVLKLGCDLIDKRPDRL